MSTRCPGRPVRRLAAATAGVLLVTAPWAVDDYTLTLISRALAIGLLAVSVAVPTGWAGLASPGQVAPYAVGAYTAANLARAGVDIGLTQLAAAGLAGAAFAALTGLVLVRARDVTFLLISLLVGVLTATAAGNWAALTGGTNGLADRYLYTAIVGAGAIAGAAGALTITATGYISPADVGFEVAVLVLLAVAIGGATSLAGALSGAGLIVGTQNWAGPWQGHAPLLLGLLFIAAFYARTAAPALHRVRPPRREAP